MRGLGRKGRILKWAGLVLSLLMVAAWTWTLFWDFQYVRVDWTKPDPRLPNPSTFQAEWSVSLVTGGFFFGCQYCVPIYLEPGCDVSRRKVARMCWLPQLGFTPLGWISIMPLWIPFLLFTIPTFYLWRADRRIPPGHCLKCGYNLTGNISGVCPECGEPIKTR